MLIDSLAFGIIENGLSRFYLLFEVDQGRSVNIRKSMLIDAWQHIGQAPFFGYGLGSYGIVVNGIDQRAYPHNVILEIWFEAGIFAALSFIIFTIISLINASKRNEKAIIYLIIFLVLNFLKSSSLDELRLFFLVCGLSVGSIINLKRVYH